MTREEKAIRTLRGLVASCPLKHDEWQAVEVAIEALKEQRPHGEWDDNGRCTFCGCSRPHECIIADSNGNVIKYHANFCPNCGASMSANDRQVTGKLDDNTTLLYSMTNGDNFIGKEGEAE